MSDNPQNKSSKCACSEPMSDHDAKAFGPQCVICWAEEELKIPPKLEYTMGDWFNDLENPHGNR